jgi:hypothetical protein
MAELFPIDDPNNPSEEVLNHSLQMIDQSMADIASGRVLSVSEAKKRALDDMHNSSSRSDGST